jgi:hypothetical protein
MHIEAELNYIIDSGETPIIYVDWPEEEHNARPPSYKAHRCRINNGRPLKDQFTLPTHGFTFFQHCSKVENFYDSNLINSIYDGEVATLIKTYMGAENVHVFDHTFRTANNAVALKNNTRAPVKSAHNDYTERSARQRLRDFLPVNEAQKRLKRRFAIVQTWRPIRHPVQSEPFAICDGQTIPEEGFVTLYRRYSYRTAETYHLSYHPDHLWYYFPKMTPDEVIMFKVFDSDRSKGVPFTAHTAFDDPNTPINAPLRESVESRALVFF